MTVELRDVPVETEDIIDVRDVIARIEYLREIDTADRTDEDTDELAEMLALMSDLEGMGGDEQWEGTWYPLTLIRDDCFEDYARELADDIGAVNADQSWPNSFIDWPAAAAALQQDYSSVEFRSFTYWTR